MNKIRLDRRIKRNQVSSEGSASNNDLEIEEEPFESISKKIKESKWNKRKRS